jgi:hypothetical protein
VKKKLLESDEINDLVSVLDMITNFSRELVKNLESSVSKDTVGQNLLPILPFLKIYKDYFNNYEKCAHVIRTAKKQDKKFYEWLHQTERKSKKEHRLDMQSLMISPVQRIPKYNLLLKQLLSHTVPSHSDYNNIFKALEGTTFIADFLNTKMKEMRKDQNKERLVTTLKFRDETLLDAMLRPQRTYVWEGALEIVESSRFIIPYDISAHHYYILMNDMILVCEKRETKMFQPIRKQHSSAIRVSWQWAENLFGGVDYKLGAHSMDDDLQNFYVIHHFMLDGDTAPWVITYKCHPQLFQLVYSEGSILFKCCTAEEQVQWVEQFNTYASNKNLATNKLPQPYYVLSDASLTIQSLYRGVKVRQSK